MDKLSTYDIAWKGLSEGSHQFDFDINDDFFAAFEGSEIKGGELTATVNMHKSSRLLTFETRINGNVITECDRCLGRLSLPVDYSGVLQVKFSDEPADYDGEIMWLHPDEGTVPLAQYIYESIVLSLPYRRIHGTDSEGHSLCDSDMLARFSIVDAEAFDTMTANDSTTLADTMEGEKLRQLKAMIEDKTEK